LKVFGRVLVSVAAVGLAFTAAVRPSVAQPRVVRGLVSDHRSRPIASAAVIAAGAGAAGGAVTDDSGRFQIEIPHQNRVTFDVRRVGFMPSRVGLDAGGDTNVTVLLLPATTVLPGVAVIQTELRPPALAGFEQRMRERTKGAGPGRFITAEEIAKMSPNRTTQVLENENSLSVRRVGADRYAVFGRASGGVSCPATLYLDGVRLLAGGQQIRDRRGRVVGREAGAPIDEFVTPQEIGGIEIYPRALLAPAQFQPPANDDLASRCAIVVVWTKHG
jgi:hypothetical protein